MKNKLILIEISLILILICSSCSSSIPYNAVLYDHADDYFKPEFLENNKLYGIYYYPDDKMMVDCPWTRTYIVSSQNDLESMMDDYESLDVDFDTKMLIIYTYVSKYEDNVIKIQDIKVNDKVANIKLKMHFPFGKSSLTSKFQRFLIIKLDKQEITSATFNRCERK